MCLTIDDSVKSLSKRIVWKVFNKDTGKIASLYQCAIYPKGKLVERSKGQSRWKNTGTHGLHFYLTKAIALKQAEYFNNTYIAKFSVNPKDFMFAGEDDDVMYERATRVGNYIKVKPWAGNWRL